MCSNPWGRGFAPGECGPGPPRSKQAAQRVARKTGRGQKDRAGIRAESLDPRPSGLPVSPRSLQSQLRAPSARHLGYKSSPGRTLAVFFALLVAKNNPFVIKSCFGELT